MVDNEYLIISSEIETNLIIEDKYDINEDPIVSIKNRELSISGQRINLIKKEELNMLEGLKNINVLIIKEDFETFKKILKSVPIKILN